MTERDMVIEWRAGLRLRSAVSDTEVIVVTPPSEEVELACGGAPMVPVAGSPSEEPPQGTGAPVDDGETLIGKRYEDEGSGLVVLCTKGGKGSLTVGGEPMPVQAARTLPSSD